MIFAEFQNIPFNAECQNIPFNDNRKGWDTSKITKVSMTYISQLKVAQKGDMCEFVILFV